MNMPASKFEGATPLGSVHAASATIVPISIKAPSIASRTLALLSGVAARVIPPVVVIALCLLLWEALCSKPGASLPPPSRVLEETWELIVDPF